MYGDETWRVYDVLDQSLAPSGPDSLYELAGTYLTASARLLDAGCRDAAHLIRLVQLYGVTGVGVDPVELHVERAKAAIEAAGVADRAEAFVDTMNELPFPDGHFDFVWCRDVVAQVDDLEGALREVSRVLSPGGHMLVYTTFRTDQVSAPEAELLRRHLGNVPENMIEANVEAAFQRAGFFNRVERRDRHGMARARRGATTPHVAFDATGSLACAGSAMRSSNGSGRTSATASRRTCTGRSSSSSASCCRSCTSFGAMPRPRNTPSHGGYVVLQHVGGDEWRMVGEMDRRPGLPARKSRRQAVRDAIGREPGENEVFAVVPRSEWRNGLDH